MVITVSSIKGGVGKSSLVILLANNLAARGNRVLVIDMDLNNMTTLFYTMGLPDIKESIDRKNIMIALSQEKAEENIIETRVANVDIIPSSLSLCKIRAIDFRVLKRVIKDLDYDFILVDTSPNYDNLVMNAMYAADLIITPVQLTEFCFNMANFLMDTIEEELPEQRDKCVFLYNNWHKNYKPNGKTVQAYCTNLFESRFNNIMDAKIPATARLDEYTNCDKKLSVNSKDPGTAALAKEINRIAKFLTNDTYDVEEF